MMDGRFPALVSTTAWPPPNFYFGVKVKAKGCGCANTRPYQIITAMMSAAPAFMPQQFSEAARNTNSPNESVLDRGPQERDFHTPGRYCWIPL